MSDEYEDESEEKQVAVQGIGDLLTKVDPQEAVAFVGKFLDLARESKITEREVERYRAMRDIAITEITEKYKFAHELMNKTFEERRKIIEKDFELVDKGIEQHDYQLVNAGLQHITTTIKDNPFKLFQVTTADQRRKMLEDGDLALE